MGLGHTLLNIVSPHSVQPIANEDSQCWIIANGEFLEVIYGENQHLKNILHAAGKAKRQLWDIQDKRNGTL